MAIVKAEAMMQVSLMIKGGLALVLLLLLHGWFVLISNIFFSYLLG
jgi:hypothetical protein